jgi:hypothetical protein
MPLKRVTFIGNPDNPKDGRHSVEAFGEIYVLRHPRNVNLSATAFTKLSNNSHFTVDDVPEEAKLAPRLEAVAESHALKNASEPDPGDRGEPNPPNHDSGPEQSGAGESPSIPRTGTPLIPEGEVTIRRERSRSPAPRAK